MFWNWCTGYKWRLLYSTSVPLNPPQHSVNRKTGFFKPQQIRERLFFQRRLKASKMAKKGKNPRMLELWLFQSLKENSQQWANWLCHLPVNHPSLHEQPYLLPLSHAAHNNHTSHTRTTKGHSWTTDLDCCFTLKLTSKTSLHSGLKQLCVGDPLWATTLSFSNLVFLSLKHSKTIVCFCCIL